MLEFEFGRLEQDGCFVHDGLLYTLQAPPGKAEYPRLVLPPSAWCQVIRRVHAKLGHQGIRKTLDRVQEAYKWPCQRKDVGDVIAQCARCIVHKNKRERPEPGSMPIAHYPGQIVGMDMTGPYPLSRHGNLYALSIIDHCTGWVEVKPLPKTDYWNCLRILRTRVFAKIWSPRDLDFWQWFQIQKSSNKRIPRKDWCWNSTLYYLTSPKQRKSGAISSNPETNAIQIG